METVTDSLPSLIPQIKSGSRLFKGDQFNLLINNYSYGSSQLFLKRKEEDHFVELSGGSGSSGGGRQTFTGFDPRAKKYFHIFSHNESMLVSVTDDRKEAMNCFDFHFLKEEIVALMALKQSDPRFLGLPDTRVVESAWGNENIVIIVDHPLYLPLRTNRFFIGNIIKGIREVKITNFIRYRDGGTTFVETEEGTLFYPTPFSKDPEKYPYWEPTGGEKEKISDVRESPLVDVVLQKLGIERS